MRSAAPEARPNTSTPYRSQIVRSTRAGAAKNPRPRLPEDLEERHLFDFGGDHRLDRLPHEPLIQRTPDPAYSPDLAAAG